MTNRTDAAATAADLISALRDELLGEPQKSDDPAPLPDEEQWAASLLAAATPERAIESAARSLLTDDSPLLTADRTDRLVAAVDRALEPLAERALPLPLLLRTRRLRTGTALDELAAAIGLEPAALDHLERGGHDVGGQDESVVAKWIDAVPVDQDLALSALNRTLTWEQRASGDLAAGRTADPADVDTFVERVRSLLSPRPLEGEL